MEQVVTIHYNTSTALAALVYNETAILSDGTQAKRIGIISDLLWIHAHRIWNDRI